MFDKNYFSEDILEFLRLLYKFKVRYVIVGGEAVIYYGHARLTGAIDIYYENEIENVNKLWNVLLEFWNNNIPGLRNVEELRKFGIIIQFGVPPNRIDLMNLIDGVDFNMVWGNCIKEKIDLDSTLNIEINLIGLRELIINKEKSNRLKDNEDLKFLKKI